LRNKKFVIIIIFAYFHIEEYFVIEFLAISSRKIIRIIENKRIEIDYYNLRKKNE